MPLSCPSRPGFAIKILIGGVKLIIGII